MCSSRVRQPFEYEMHVNRNQIYRFLILHKEKICNIRKFALDEFRRAENVLLAIHVSSFNIMCSTTIQYRLHTVHIQLYTFSDSGHDVNTTYDRHTLRLFSPLTHRIALEINFLSSGLN